MSSQLSGTEHAHNTICFHIHSNIYILYLPRTILVIMSAADHTQRAPGTHQYIPKVRIQPFLIQCPNPGISEQNYFDRHGEKNAL